MKILKYSYIWIFAATSGIMTACTPDEKEGMFSGKGEPVTVKFSIDTRVAETDDFDSQVKTLRVYAFQNGSPVGYYYGGEDVPAHTFEWKLPKGEVWFYAVANEQEAGELLCENKGDIFVLPGEIAGGVHPVEGLEVTPDKLESLTFSRLPEAEYVSGGTETGKDETGKIYCSAIVPMTGKCRETVANDHQEIKLVLKRSVAKLNLYFAKADVTDAGKGQLYMGADCTFIIYRNTGICFQKRSTNIRELSIVWKERVTVPIPGIRKTER
ncbi:FimB/Mfa2 family fimbrial subunit [Phocaeicola sp.]|uniref:FimB/Mfa2 family fimbrial subunit n=1 Tax=Phocaeicola sp. TaxID=2773926 RepID=UPI003AAFE117